MAFAADIASVFPHSVEILGFQLRITVRVIGYIGLIGSRPRSLLLSLEADEIARSQDQRGASHVRARQIATPAARLVERPIRNLFRIVMHQKFSYREHPVTMLADTVAASLVAAAGFEVSASNVGS
jgi:hypothetical protein